MLFVFTHVDYDELLEAFGHLEAKRVLERVVDFVCCLVAVVVVVVVKRGPCQRLVLILEYVELERYKQLFVFVYVSFNYYSLGHLSIVSEEECNYLTMPVSTCRSTRHSSRT